MAMRGAGPLGPTIVSLGIIDFPHINIDLRYYGGRKQFNKPAIDASQGLPDLQQDSHNHTLRSGLDQVPFEKRITYNSWRTIRSCMGLGTG